MEEKMEVEATFFTKIDDPILTLPSSSSYMIPATLSRKGLSQLLNNLLNLDPPRVFDFLIKSEFLRVDLKTYMRTHGFTGESIVEIEYVFAKLPPESEILGREEDWISSICISRDKVLTGNYDSCVRCYSEKDICWTSKGMSCVTALSTKHLDDAGDPHTIVFQGLKNGKILFQKSDKSLSVTPKVFAGTQGHEGGVLSLASFHTDAVLASGGQDGRILLWRYQDFESPQESSLKRNRETEVAPWMALEQHTDSVTSIEAPVNSALMFNVLTGSLDCSFRLYDAVSGAIVSTYKTSRAVLSLSSAPTSKRVCTGNEDGRLLVWDLNETHHSGDQAKESMSYSCHKRVLSCCRWNPWDENVIASISHDGNLRILDLRSPKLPIQSLEVTSEKDKQKPIKLLAACWLENKKVAIGGEDGILRVVNTHKNE